MEWFVLAVVALFVALAGRWTASALWVRMISDRWNEFDAAQKATGSETQGDRPCRGSRT